MNGTTLIATGALAAWLLLGAAAFAASPETTDQTPTGSTGTAAAGVEHQPAAETSTQGVEGDQTQCRSASAKMTDGSVMHCKP